MLDPEFVPKYLNTVDKTRAVLICTLTHCRFCLIMICEKCVKFVYLFCFRFLKSQTCRQSYIVEMGYFCMWTISKSKVCLCEAKYSRLFCIILSFWNLTGISWLHRQFFKSTTNIINLSVQMSDILFNGYFFNSSTFLSGTDKTKFNF